MYIFIAEVVVIVIAVVFWLRFNYLSSNLNQIVYDRGGLIPEDIQKEWEDLSWNRLPGGPQPLRVIKLAGLMVADEPRLKESTHMTSSYYSQVKYLVKMGHFPTALVFLARAKAFARSALECRKGVPLEKRNPIELEVLGAPDFMLASIPIIGRAFKSSALRFLMAAQNEITGKEMIVMLKEPEYTIDLSDLLSAALIWSKMYSLTRDKAYKLRVLEACRMKEQSDVGQVSRIAKHLGFKTREDLLRSCDD